MSVMLHRLREGLTHTIWVSILDTKICTTSTHIDHGTCISYNCTVSVFRVYFTRWFPHEFFALRTTGELSSTIITLYSRVNLRGHT